jgi:hypothetical protein
MQILVTLPDDIGKELIALPNADNFVSELVRVALQYCVSSDQTTFKKPQKRTLGLLEGKGHFEIKDNFKMTDEELFSS